MYPLYIFDIQHFFIEFSLPAKGRDVCAVSRPTLHRVCTVMKILEKLCNFKMCFPGFSGNICRNHGKVMEMF